MLTPAGFVEAIITSVMLTDVSSPAVADSGRSRRRAGARSSATSFQFAVARPWAATSAAAATVRAGARVVARIPLAAPPAGTNRNGQSLYDAGLTLLLAGVHSVIDGEVSADHIGRFGGLVTGQLLGLIG